MDFLPALWLPILLSAVAVWFVSMIVWTALPHHKGDFVGLPESPGLEGGQVGGEDAFMEFIRKSGIPPGNYMFPDARTRAAMSSAKVQTAWEKGPVGHLSVWPTPLTMGGKLVGTFVVYLVVSAFIAGLTRAALPPVAGASPSFAKVFEFAGAAGVLAYCFSSLPTAIWWSAYKRTMVANVIDGVIYAAITGAIFAWLWPG